MRFSLMPIVAFLQLTSAEITFDQDIVLDEPLFDSTAPLTGNDKCVIINVVMDESSSMETEQAFMKDDALPGMIQKLKGPGFSYDHVFVCTNGFGDDTGVSLGYYAEDYRHIGCTVGIADGTLVDNSVTDFVSTGGWEEGYHAMFYSIKNVPQTIGDVNLQTTCGTMAKNLILVTDEDRDSELFPVTMQEMKTYIKDNGYVLNIVVDAEIEGSTENIGLKAMNSGADHTIFVADGTGYTTYSHSEDYRGFVRHTDDRAVGTNEHYVPLIFDEPGAMWNVGSLRDGTQNNLELRAAFTNAFIDVKAEEIRCPGGTLVDGLCTCPGGEMTESGCECPSNLINLNGACTCPPGTFLQNGSCRDRTEITPPPQVGGDPHITTWAKEHYEYHGQCDLVMMEDPEFAEGLGLTMHIRTKLVRYWSYIKTVAIKIGNEILEIEGSADVADPQPHYWVNFEYQGDLEDFAGFPVVQKAPVPYVRTYQIDLDSKFPGHSIIIKIYKEFVNVKFIEASKDAYGKTVGLFGDWKTGKTLARDGVTEMNDFTEFGDEWQVLPSEPKIFHEVTQPQFPEPCIKPENPRGERKRRLAESAITIQQAEKACAKLEDPLNIKDCVYDILATQDVGMVGAF